MSKEKKEDKMVIPVTLTMKEQLNRLAISEGADNFSAWQRAEWRKRLEAAGIKEK